MMNTTFLTLLLFAIVLVCLSVIGFWHFYLPHKQKRDKTLRDVQCPQCQRWKKLAPLQQEKPEDAMSGIHPHTHNLTAHTYKCPFCGNRWRETFVS